MKKYWKQVRNRTKQLLNRLRDVSIMITQYDCSASASTSIRFYQFFFWSAAGIALIAGIGLLLLSYNGHIDEKLLSARSRYTATRIMNKSIDDQIRYIDKVRRELEPLNSNATHAAMETIPAADAVSGGKEQ